MKINFFFIFLFFISSIFSKNLIFTLVDRVNIKVGEPICYSIFLNKKYYRSYFINIINQEIKKSKIGFNSCFIDSITYPNYIYYNLILTSFVPGKQIIPSFQYFIDKNILQTKPYFITVSTIDIDYNQLYKDIKNLENIHFSFFYEFLYYLFKYISYILFFLLLLSFYIIFIKFFNKKRYKYVYITSYFNKTIYEINKLKSKNYIETSNFRLFYIEFSDLVRDYLSSYYQIPAKILLTDDLLNFIKFNNLVSKIEYQFLVDIFKISDSVKFAKFIPDRNLCIEQLNKFIEFVNKKEN